MGLVPNDGLHGEAQALFVYAPGGQGTEERKQSAEGPGGNLGSGPLPTEFLAWLQLFLVCVYVCVFYSYRNPKQDSNASEELYC